MKKFFLLFITILLLNNISEAQSRAYGVKGGLTIGTQRWGNIDQDPLFSYHGAISLETVPEDDSFGLFLQAGYHVKGSAWRNTFFTNQTGNVSIFTQKFKFENVALVLGFKKNFSEFNIAKLYYLFGIRGDYTVRTNLDDYIDQNILIGGPAYPFDEAVRKFNYGATAGAGAQIPLTEFISAIIEFTISPDFSDQYRQGPFTVNVFQNGSSTPRNFAERKIRNLVFEVSVGFRFLHKIEYID